MQIRKAQHSDLWKIKKLAKEARDNDYRNIMGQNSHNLFLKSQTSEISLEECIKESFVLTQQDKIVGFSVIKGNLIDLMVIDANYHRKGLGTELLKHCEKILFKNFDEIIIECPPENAMANLFCQKNGWIEKCRHYDHTDGQERIFFYKKLFSRNNYLS